MSNYSTIKETFSELRIAPHSQKERLLLAIPFIIVALYDFPSFLNLATHSPAMYLGNWYAILMFMRMYTGILGVGSLVVACGLLLNKCSSRWFALLYIAVNAFFVAIPLASLLCLSAAYMIDHMEIHWMLWIYRPFMMVILCAAFIASLFYINPAQRKKIFAYWGVLLFMFTVMEFFGTATAGMEIIMGAALFCVALILFPKFTIACSAGLILLPIMFLGAAGLAGTLGANEMSKNMR